LVVFIPTYSTVPYGKMNLIHIIIPVVFLLLCMKSSISEKLSILVDRFMIVSGLTRKEEEPKKKDGQGNHGHGPQLSQPMLPPPVSTTVQPSYQEAMYQPQGQPNQREQQFGISEPFAANEIYGLNSYN